MRRGRAGRLQPGRDEPPAPLPSRDDGHDHRVLLFGRPVSPWFPTAAAAMREAVRLGHADRGPDGVWAVTLIVPADIQRRRRVTTVGASSSTRRAR